ncbi:MAG: hypothetical protein OXC37_00705 [Bdellovibrionaceae bacterium]|nr:hypothetical protein [Pseudobdellovibrionaceae bacterium]
MKFDQRSFVGKSFRPLPDFQINEGLKILSLLTAWGPTDQNNRVLDFLSQNYEEKFSDSEKTANYPKLESLSLGENRIRKLLLECNEWIFRELNEKKRGQFAYELFCGNFEKNEFIFSQIGQPFVYLDREGLPLQSLGAPLDFSALLAHKAKRLAPLPSSLIGLYPDTHFSVFSLPLQAKDRVFFFCRDIIPLEILQIPNQKRNLDSFLEFFVSEDEKAPCWLGELSFE